MPKKKLKIKGYAVVWTDLGREEYGVEDSESGLISIEPKEDIKVNISKNRLGRPKYRYVDSHAIFETKQEALAFMDGNKDWKIIPVEIKEL